MTKLLENIFRSVNIALVNELAMLCDRMKIDIWEVVEAAATQALRLHEVPARPRPRRPLHPHRSLLPLAGRRASTTSGPSSSSSPARSTRTCPTSASRRSTTRSTRAARACNGAKVLVLGVAYKADIDDLRESPALKVIRRLQEPRRLRRLPRPARARAAPSSACTPWPSTGDAGIGAYDVGGHRHRALRRRLPRGRRARAAGGRPAQRDRRHPGERQGVEALETRGRGAAVA